MKYLLLLFVLVFGCGCAHDVNPDLEMMLHFYQQHHVQKHKLFEMTAFPGETIRLQGVSSITVWAPEKDFQFDKIMSSIPRRKNWWESTVDGLTTLAMYASPVVGYVLGLEAQGRSIVNALTASGGGQRTWAGDYTIWTDSPYTIENNPVITETTEVTPND